MPTLPFFCDPGELPGPLPSFDEIVATGQIFPGNSDYRYQRVALVREKFVVKYGVSPWVSENEGHALLLLAKYPSIPVPQLYAIYREGDRLFLIMEFKEGTYHIFTQVHKIPSPGVFSNVAGGPLRHCFFLSAEPTPQINGLFQNEMDFSMAMAMSVFTHDDLQRKNILVPNSGNPDESKKKWRVTAKFERILDPCPLEAGRFVRQDLGY
ncbi:hypothetical protein C7999DRAFT_44925 [Corynascus novoguineensis]|uniref:Protein kinase domain-containing protein n=1 Tax=Corynascus novoguineensis TaxID=1126955 RepID=A0AAN7CK19_9PEZI|nr:hypothetical protein C7999DRAFT_44925 [Corynascus novoguineensis]